MGRCLGVLFCMVGVLVQSVAFGQSASLDWHDELRFSPSVIEVRGDGGDRIYIGYNDSDDGNPGAEGFHVVAYSPDGERVSEARTSRADHYYSFVGMDNDSGHLYVTGTDYGTQSGRVITVAYKTPELHESWVVEHEMSGYDQTDAFAVLADGMGNVLVVGLATRFGVNYSESEDTARVFVLKYDPFGNLLWQGEHGIDMGEFDDQGARDSVGVDSFGNVYVSLGNELAKYSPSGELLWIRDVPGATLLVDAEDCVVSTAAMLPSWTGFPGKGVTERIDPDGQTLWKKDVGGFSLASNGSGDVWVAGPRAKFSWIFRLKLDFETSRIGLDGTVKWTRHYNVSRNDVASGIEVDEDDNAYVVGLVQEQSGFFRKTYTPHNDVVKYDSSGRELFRARHDVREPARPGMSLGWDGSFYLVNDTGIARYSE